MDITLLCSTGLALHYGGKTLLIDAPNIGVAPFHEIPAQTKLAILERKKPFDTVCGLCYTHTHPDHCDGKFLAEYQRLWPEIPCLYPKTETVSGTVTIDGFDIEYRRITHTPIDLPLPSHVVLLITAGEKSIYITADAETNCDAHKAFLNGRRVQGAFWNAMYLSRPETRQLMMETADLNYIYHMPEDQNDSAGIWRKCRLNEQRFPEELSTVTVLGQYPTFIRI